MKDIVKYLQLGLLGIILISTVIAVMLEINLMFSKIFFKEITIYFNKRLCINYD